MFPDVTAKDAAMTYPKVDLTQPANDAGHTGEAFGIKGVPSSPNFPDIEKSVLSFWECSLPLCLYLSSRLVDSYLTLICCAEAMVSPSCRRTYI